MDLIERWVCSFPVEGFCRLLNLSLPALQQLMECDDGKEKCFLKDKIGEYRRHGFRSDQHQNYCVTQEVNKPHLINSLQTSSGQNAHWHTLAHSTKTQAQPPKHIITRKKKEHCPTTPRGSISPPFPCTITQSFTNSVDDDQNTNQNTYLP
ncbi:hypothetical protein CEXT_62511 [Caerostris extrusa]|uniref:Uncharacterized protein n=1 Tax=Caerostris extrusa TaxID=172846 RepID=A0AAV4M8B1_CAEEX|nr:hypothetical protein CEXT_62511 [Caerostris extrusa]